MLAPEIAIAAVADRVMVGLLLLNFGLIFTPQTATTGQLPRKNLASSGTIRLLI
jgi:hypothetical protein